MSDVMSRKFIIGVVLSFISFSVISAQGTIDSLKTILKHRVAYATMYDDTHVHLNSILKLSYDEYGSDSKEYRRAILWCAAFCAEAGDVKQAKRIYDEVRNHISDTLEQISALKTLIRIYESDNENLAISNMKSLEQIQAQYYGACSDERLNTLLDIAEQYAVMGRNEKSDRYLSKASEVLRLKLDDEFSVSTERGRNIYWDKVARFFYRFTDVAHNESGRLAKGKRINRNAFDAVLLSKGILLGTEREYDKFITSLENPIADSLFAVKKNLVLQNAGWPQIDAADNELVEYLKREGCRYHNPQFDVFWTDVQDAMGKDDLVIEFFKTSKNMFGALFFKKGWRAPMCIKINGVVKVGNEMHSLTSVLPYEPRPHDSRYNREMSCSIAEVVWPKKLVRHFPRSKEGKVYFSTVAELDITPIEYIGDMHEKYNMCRLSSSRQLVSRDAADARKSFRAGLYGGIDYNVTASMQKAAVDSILFRYEHTRDKGVMMRDHDYEDLFTAISSESKVRGAVESLPSSLEEVVSISDMCVDNDLISDVFTGRYATEEAFKMFSTTEQILHFATHGFYYSPDEACRKLDFEGVYDYSDPMLRSGINLAGVSGKDSFGNVQKNDLSDGMLVAREIAQTDLSQAELIVLSACNSGKGDIEQDGVFGIQRAFKIAGANTIIMSLWPVSDKVAKDMMVMFYRNLTQDMQGDRRMIIYDAFYRALRDLRLKYPDDYLWSPFIVLDAV